MYNNVEAIIPRKKVAKIFIWPLLAEWQITGKRSKLMTIRFFLSLFLVVQPFAVLGQTLKFQRALDPFFEQHCYECHDDSVKKGDLDLFALSGDLNNPEAFSKWERIYDRVSSGEMPPKKKEQPKAARIAFFRKALGVPLAEAHQARKGTVLRRLNRKEYQNTLNDIFGTNIDLVSILPEDGRSHEFDNIGEALGISMIQMQRYLEGIEKVLDAAIADRVDPPEVKVKAANYVDSREGKQFIPKTWGKAPDGAVVFFRRTGYPSGMLRGSNVSEDGYYKVKVTGYAFQSEQPITFSVAGTSFARGSTKPTYGYFSFKPGKPQTIEFTQLIRRNYMISITPRGLKDENNFIREKKSTVGYTGPGLAINKVEVNGPIHDQFPSQGHRLIFEGIDRELTNPGKRYPIFKINSDDPKADAAGALLRIASKAFRRPVSEEEIVPFVELFEEQFAEQKDFEFALRAAISSIFVSPQFLYLREKPGFLDDFALASRLSYAFGRTLPDGELLVAAETKKLSRDPNFLWNQAERILEGENFDRFIEDFCDAWLNLRDIEFTTPDTQLFPQYDSYLHYSLIEETKAFFKELLTQNLPVRNIVKSDFAMLNNRLATHYGIEGVDGPKIRKVKLPQGNVRGGFLSQGSILKVSANGTNTSPVVRGVWVMERILGKTPPPPPAGVPGVEPDIRGASTLRELLDKHRDSESCAGCHREIDPPGFALESFNPIGGWRDNFRSLGEGEKVNLEFEGRKVRYRIGPKVDCTGQLADGTSFSGFNEFRDLLIKDEDRLARAFVTKLLTFCSGREMGFSDRPTINRIVRESAEGGHGMKDLVKLVVLSEVFRKK